MADIISIFRASFTRTRPLTTCWRLFLALTFFAVALAVRFAILPVENGMAFLTFYPATAFAALLLGAESGLLVTALGTIASYYIFLPPYWSFLLDQDRILSLITFAGSGAVICLIARQKSLYIRKMEESAARLSENHDFARSILNSVSPHIAILDSSGTIIEVNAAWQRFARENGMPPGRGGMGESYLAACTGSGTPDATEPRVAAAGIDAVLARHETEFTLEYPCHSPDRNRWFLMRVRPLATAAGGVVVSHDDISPLKAVEQALKEARDHAETVAKSLAESEQFLRTLARDLPGMVGYWDTGLRCRFANKHYLEWFGTTPEQMQGIAIQDLMGEALFARNEPFIRGALRGENQTFERRLVKANGEVGDTLARYIVDKDGRGQVRGFLALVTDVTDLKRTELRLKEANAQLRMARDDAEAANLAKSRFLATMSHELRTPLHTIIGFSEIILDPRHSLTRDDQCAEYIGDIHASATHLLNVVNDVLDVSKIEAGYLEVDPVSLPTASVLAGVARLFSERAHKSLIALEIAVSPDTPDLWADEQAVKQILFNLISNALKFTPAGGRITLATAPADGGVDVSIVDTGVGIPAEQVERVLKPFEQIDNQYAKSRGGTGLGLSVVQGLVTLHGGTLSVRSVVGQGTTVTVHFPSALPSPEIAQVGNLVDRVPLHGGGAPAGSERSLPMPA